MDETKPTPENLEPKNPAAAGTAPAATDTATTDAAAAAATAAGATAGAVTASTDSGKNLDFILDIPLRVSVELGRTKILVQDLLKLHKGSVMELNKLAGEPLEVLVNNRVVARGEVIVINEKFGIRLTDIVNHAERIRELGAAA